MPNMNPPKVVARTSADPAAAEVVKMADDTFWLRDPITRAMLHKLDPGEVAKIASDPRTLHFRV
jgi:hypothetical protein